MVSGQWIPLLGHHFRPCGWLSLRSAIATDRSRNPTLRTLNISHGDKYYTCCGSLLHHQHTWFRTTYLQSKIHVLQFWSFSSPREKRVHEIGVPSFSKRATSLPFPIMFFARFVHCFGPSWGDPQIGRFRGLDCRTQYPQMGPISWWCGCIMQSVYLLLMTAFPPSLMGDRRKVRCIIHHVWCTAHTMATLMQTPRRPWFADVWFSLFQKMTKMNFLTILIFLKIIDNLCAPNHTFLCII